MTTKNTLCPSSKLKYDCPVCFDRLFSPIFQCFNGHLLCGKCIKGLPECPLCRDPLPERNIRALAVENFIQDSLIPCPFSQEGCEHLLIDDSEFEKYHQFNCDYAVVNYCSLLGLRCVEKVTKRLLLEHFVTQHEGVCYRNYVYGQQLKINQERLIVFFETDVAHKEQQRSLALINSGENTFAINCTIDGETKMISWVVLFLGCERSARRFATSIKLESKEQQINTNTTTLKWKGSVFSIKYNNCVRQLGKEEIFSVPYEHYPSLFSSGKGNRSGELTWKLMVKIINQETGAHKAASNTLTTSPIQHRVYCDGDDCNNDEQTWLAGTRYKCIECEDYDLCENCMKRNLHPQHLFVVVPRPGMGKQLRLALQNSSKVKCNV